MSQDFKFKFDAMRENNPANQKGTDSEDKGENYTYSTARNICFIWPDGRKQFLSYSYLIDAEYDPGHASVICSFTTHKITMKGYNLEKLFDELMLHVPRKIVCIDPRYNATVSVDKDVVVNDIAVELV